MNRIGRAGVMLALGAITARLLWDGGYGWFVQQRMRYPLIGAAVVLLAFGIYELWFGYREVQEDEEAEKRSAGPVVGWLLVLPLVVLLSVAPTGLGAAAADRVGNYTPTDSSREFAPLDTSAGPVELAVFDFIDRAYWDDSGSLEGTTVRMEGLVVNDPELPDGFRLTRFLVSCCAADGVPIQVVLHDTGPPLPNDAWVVADVVWRRPDVPYVEQEGERLVEADAVAITVLPEAPTDAYESLY